MPYRGAFDCENCPQTADVAAKRACPAWWETSWTNDQGETKFERSCAFTQLPHYLNLFAREARGAAVSAQEARDEVIRGVHALALATNAGLEDVKAAIDRSSARASNAGAVDSVHGNHTRLPTDRGSVQQPGFWDNGGTADTATSNGPDVLRHNPR